MNWYKKAQQSLYDALMALRSQMAAAAQQVYNEWTQDAEGVDEILGSGGICQDIADRIGDVVIQYAGLYPRTMEAQCGEQHVWILVYNEEEGYHVDIAPSVYETGGGYTWKKIPDVVFDADHVEIYPADQDTIQWAHEDGE